MSDRIRLVYSAPLDKAKEDTASVGLRAEGKAQLRLVVSNEQLPPTVRTPVTRTNNAGESQQRRPVLRRTNSGSVSTAVIPDDDPAVEAEFSRELSFMHHWIDQAVKHYKNGPSAVQLSFYQNNYAKMLLTGIYFDWFVSHDIANNFLNRPCEALGGMTPMKYACNPSEVRQVLYLILAEGHRRRPPKAAR